MQQAAEPATERPGMYDRVQHKRRKKRLDRRLWTALALALLLLLPMVLSSIWSVWYRHRWYAFVGDLSDSVVYAYDNACLSAHDAEGPRPVKPSQGYTFYNLVAQSGPGRLVTAPAEAPQLTLDFGDGSRAEIWDTALVNARNNRRYGLCVRYTGSDGRTYTFDTDRMTAERVLLALALP